MRIDGKELIRASQATVWEVVNDPAVLARCLPGCKGLHPTGEGTYHVELELGLAAIKGKYTGKLSMTDLRAPEFLRLNVEAKGSPGWAKGSWEVSLVPTGDAVTVAYAGDAQVGGLIAGVGQRVLGGVAKIVMGEFFKTLGQEVAKVAK